MDDKLFNQRKLLGIRLKDVIRDRGLALVSFSKRLDISKSALDMIINGEIDDQQVLSRYMQSILDFFELEYDDLLHYQARVPAFQPTIVLPINSYTFDHRKEYEYSFTNILDICANYY